MKNTDFYKSTFSQVRTKKQIKLEDFEKMKIERDDIGEPVSVSKKIKSRKYIVRRRITVSAAIVCLLAVGFAGVYIFKGSEILKGIFPDHSPAIESAEQNVSAILSESAKEKMKIESNGLIFPDGLEVLFEEIPAFNDEYANFEIDFWYNLEGEFIRGAIEVDALQSYNSEDNTQWYSTQTLRIAEESSVTVETANDSGWSKIKTVNELPCWAPESNTLITICNHTINKVINSYNYYDLRVFFENLNMEGLKEYRIVNELIGTYLYEQFDLSNMEYKLPDSRLEETIYAEAIISDSSLTVYPSWLFVIPYDVQDNPMIENAVMICGQEIFEY